MKVLHLTLKKKWFDMIVSGEKKEEYREIKPHWEARLQDFDIVSRNNSTPLKRPFRCRVDFTHVVFRNGYSATAISITVECLGIEIGTGKPEWGAVPNQLYFVIRLGNQVLNKEKA